MKNKLRMWLLGCTLFFSAVSFAASPPTAIQFDVSKQKWNSVGTPIPNMDQISLIFTLGKTNFAFGCEEEDFLCGLLGNYTLVSFNSGSGWNTAQPIPNMESIIGSLYFPVDPAARSPQGWILGPLSNGSGWGASYFNGNQFLSAVSIPINIEQASFFASHQKFWVFDKTNHRSFWTTDTEWHEGNPFPGSALLTQVTVDSDSNDIYQLLSDGMINHLLPNGAWDTSIHFPKSADDDLLDLRVLNNGKIMLVLTVKAHIFISQDGGKNWKDTGQAMTPKAYSFIDILNGNTTNILWELTPTALRYLNPYDANPVWVNLPLSKHQLKLETSMDGTQAWLYGLDSADQFTVFYYDLNRNAYSEKLTGIDYIYRLEASADGKAFAVGTQNNSTVVSYFNGKEWINTPLTNMSDKPSNIPMSHLPLGFASTSYLIHWKNMVDPQFQNVWVHN